MRKAPTMAHSDDQLSCDVLFTDDDPGHTVDDDSIYSQPSTYSSISREVVFDTCNRSRQPIYRQYSEPTTDLNSSRNSSPGVTYNLDDFMPKDSPYQRYKVRANTYSEDTLRRTKRRQKLEPYQDYTVPIKPKPSPRRATWTPPTKDNMGAGASIQDSRQFHSNGQLDVDGDTGHIYEHLDICGPAKLPPVSGMLSKSQKKVVLRPLAFRPVVPNKYVTSPTHQSGQMVDGGTSLSDEGYSSTEYRSGMRAPSTGSQNPYGHIRRDSNKSKLSSEGDMTRLCDRPESYTSSNHSRMSSNQTEGYIQTPSPSDSGVGELEAVLREKDAEIVHLRETMEQNEKAILNVFEEKKMGWHLEMEELRHECDERLKISQQRAGKTEQSLLLQMFKLQQERKQLQEDNERLYSDKESLEQKCETLEKDLTSCQGKFEETQWSLQQKSGEISLLKTQLKDTKEDLSGKQNETLVLRTQLKEYQEIIDKKNKELELLERDVHESERQLRKSTEALDKLCETDLDVRECETQTESCELTDLDSDRISALREEIEGLKTEREDRQETFEIERNQWLDEKNKVICYQKQLQLNYVQMHRKNKMLESEVEQLMLEIERRDMKYTENTV